MTDGLFGPAIVAFVFAPAVFATATCFALLRSHTNSRRCEPIDAPASVLDWAVTAMPPAHREWGAAMLAELAVVSGAVARWRFALGCARVAMFLPRTEMQNTGAARAPVLGLLSIALPVLALPLLFGAAVILEISGANPLTSNSSVSSYLMPAIVRIMLLFASGCLVCGAPFGLAGRWRRERFPQLTRWGVASTVGMAAYFIISMQMFAGGE
jgi:hypothetical protein